MKRNKIFVRRAALVFVAASILAGSFAPVAQAGVKDDVMEKLKKWFPDFFMEKDTSMEPSETLRAPFAEEDLPAIKPDPLLAFGIGSGKLSETNSAPLHVPHRNSEDIGKWIDRAIAETLSLNPDDIEKHMAHVATGFTPEGLEQYKAWLSSANLLPVMQTNNLQMNGFVEETPMLLNEGAIDGRYRWLYEIPVMISFFDKNVKIMRDTTAIKDTRRLLVRVQVGRVAEGGLEHGVLIESWDVYANTRKN